MEDLYSFVGKSQVDLNRGYSDVVHREFYDGEFQTEAREDLVLHTEKAFGHPITLIHMSANFASSFHREWRHIRKNRNGLRVIWFVRRGTVQFARSHASYTLEAGEWGIIDSNVPFHCRALTDGEQFDVIFALIPAHLYLSHLAIADKLRMPLILDYAHDELVGGLLELLIASGKDTSPNVAEPLSRAFLEALADLLREVAKSHPAVSRGDELRLGEIESFVASKVTDAALSGKAVAAGCGISTSYLYRVLKDGNTALSKLIREKRVEIACEFLGSEQQRHLSIEQIATRAGFKAAAHFARAFKALKGVTPSQYRAACFSNARTGDQGVGLNTMAIL